MKLKKNRILHQCFLVEGAKSVQELLKSDFEVRMVVGTSEFLADNASSFTAIETNEIKSKDIGNVSSYKHNNSVVAVAAIPEECAVAMASQDYVLVLDDIGDPGNLGTIIRIADWYGINQIIASPATADFYNPKVISASMGSFTRVKMCHADLKTVLSGYQGSIYGALMDGIPLHEVAFTDRGVIVMGNESEGISTELQELLTARITIARVGLAESLNVAIATAVICDRMRHR